MSGTVGYTAMVFAVMYLPVFVTAIVINTAPFWTAILGFVVSGESVSKSEIVYIIGSFSGIVIMALSKQDADQVQLT